MNGDIYVLLGIHPIILFLQSFVFFECLLTRLVFFFFSTSIIVRLIGVVKHSYSVIIAKKKLYVEVLGRRGLVYQSFHINI